MSNLKAVFITDIHLAPGEDWSHCIWKYTPNEELPGLLEQWKNMVNDELKPDVVFELGDRIIDVDRATDLRNTTAVRDAVDGSVHCPVYHVDGNHDFIKRRVVLLKGNGHITRNRNDLGLVTQATDSELRHVVIDGYCELTVDVGGSALRRADCLHSGTNQRLIVTSTDDFTVHGLVGICAHRNEAYHHES